MAEGGIRIDELDPTLLPSVDHEVAAMKDGETVKLSVQQIIDLARVIIVAAITDGAPGALDTLNELAAALGDDADFAATLASQLTTINNSITTLTGVVEGKQPTDPMLTALAALDSTILGKFLGFNGADQPALKDIISPIVISGGRPTGGLFYEGSNANGRFIQFANKLQICYAQLSITDTNLTAYGNVWLGAELIWTFPSAFSATPVVLATSHPNPSRPWLVGGSTPNSPTQASLQKVQGIGTGSATLSFNALAIGYFP